MTPEDLEAIRERVRGHWPEIDFRDHASKGDAAAGDARALLAYVDELRSMAAIGPCVECETTTEPGQAYCPRCLLIQRSTPKEGETANDQLAAQLALADDIIGSLIRQRDELRALLLAVAATADVNLPAGARLGEILPPFGMTAGDVRRILAGLRAEDE